MRLLVLLAIALATAGCQQLGPALSPIGPSSLGRPEILAVSVQSVVLTRAPLRLEFTGSWIGPEPGQTVHVLTRPDLPPGTTTAAELENYINNVWLPEQMRDVDGNLAGYAAIHIFSFSPTDVNWVFIVSDSPIPPNWWL